MSTCKIENWNKVMLFKTFGHFKLDAVEISCIYTDYSLIMITAETMMDINTSYVY